MSYQVKAGSVAYRSARTTPNGKGLSYPAGSVVLLEDARIGQDAGWDVVDVRPHTEGSETSAYSFDLDPRPAHVRARDGFAGFDSWDAVLAFCIAAEADCSYPDLWYHAPLDIHPCRVRVVRVYKNRKIRIDPLSNQADNFTADFKHLDRMLQRVKS